MAGGDGSPGPARPLLLLLTILAAPWSLIGVSPSAWWESAVLLSPIIAVAAGWIGAGAWVRSLPMRSLIAAAWGLWPSLWGALYTGDAGVVALHLALPLLAWAVAAMTETAAPERYRGADGDVVIPARRAPLSGAGVAALALAWIGAIHPATAAGIACVGIVIGIVAAVHQHRRRILTRVLLAPVPALLLLAPSLLAAATSGGLVRYLWSVPAGSRDLPGPDTLSAALMLPVSSDVFTRAWGGAGTWWLWGMAALPILVTAWGVLALARPRRVWTTRCAWLGALACGVLIVVAPADAVVAPLQSLAGWCVLAAGAGWAGVGRGRLGRWCVVPAAVAAVALGLSAVAWVAMGTAIERGDGVPQASPRGQRIPPAAEIRQSSPTRARVLVLSQASGVTRAEIWRGSGAMLTDAADARQARPGPAASDLAAAIAALTLPGDADIADTLAEHAIDEVVVAHPGDEADLVAALDGIDGLTPVMRTSRLAAWRVDEDALDPAGPVARMVVVGDGERVSVGSRGVRAVAEILRASQPRTLVLAERAGHGWHARIDGIELAPVSRGWAQAFTIPAGVSGTLTVSYGPAWWPWWRAVVALSLVVAVLAAWPTRRRMRR
ncbi:hypothetical protein H8R18_01860 [Nanchangia anserum]|uniref:hypothetical protein n=1 Tax=Nanchangia anserum TaxID=2692125 RepID=UPI001883BA40|nr:hypothetical protein [Nanchangia anserum]QOX82132.1 hypothetical protein H8R18_01860 [Nanchangia anserum]